MFNDKATAVSQQTANASKCIWILAQEAQRLGEIIARGLEAQKDNILGSILLFLFYLFACMLLWWA